MKRWRTPLCSDTYSSFAKDAAEEHRAEVIAATAKLEQEIVPAFARHLVRSQLDLEFNFLLISLTFMHSVRMLVQANGAVLQLNYRI